MARSAAPTSRTVKPGRASAHELFLSLVRTADQVRRDAARVVEPHDLTAQQFNVLRILRGAGDGGLPTLEVAARMIEQTPGVTRLLDRLEAKELILVVITQRTVNLGLVKMEMRRAAKRIGEAVPL